MQGRFSAQVNAARAALTGPAARGDEATIRRHVRGLPADERRAYRGMVDAARRLAAGSGVAASRAGGERS